MYKIVRTDSANPDFVQLVRMLDVDLAERDGAEHSFYAQFNKLDKIRHAVVLYADGKAMGCGAIKEYTPDTTEVKRMFTLPEARGKGIASRILAELETWAAALGYDRCILETGLKQPEAIELYKRSGYNFIPNYGQYIGVENSVCFEKKLKIINLTGIEL